MPGVEVIELLCELLEQPHQPVQKLSPVDERIWRCPSSKGDSPGSMLRRGES